MPRVIVRVTSLKARLGEPSTGERSTGGQTSSSRVAREMRRATVALSVTCRLWATELTSGARVIRKRLRFVPRGAAGKGLSQDGASLVASSTEFARSQKRRRSPSNFAGAIRLSPKCLCWLLRLYVLTSGKKQSSRNPIYHLPGV